MIVRTYLPCGCSNTASEWANGEVWCLACGGDKVNRLGPIIADGQVCLTIRTTPPGIVDLFIVWKDIDPDKQYAHRSGDCGIAFRSDGCIAQIVIYDVQSWGEINVRRLLRLLSQHEMVVGLAGVEQAVEYVIENIDVDLTVHEVSKQR